MYTFGFVCSLYSKYGLCYFRNSGWHTTIFPPYFVAGAIFGGFAMCQTLLLIARKVVSLEDYITMKHIEYMNIIIL